METKICYKCKNELPIFEFLKKGHCSSCRKEQKKNYYQKNKDKIKEKTNKYYHSNKEKASASMKIWRLNNKEKSMWKAAKKRAVEKNLIFDIEVEDIVIPPHCPILGIPLEMNNGGPGRNSPSLDKICPLSGYTKNNIQVISYMANTMKCDATTEQLLAFADWVYKTFRKDTNVN